jgi:RNA-directed DNA polymerase
MKAALSLTDKRYKAKPLKRVYIEKYGTKKKRPLGIPTMYDRTMQLLYAFALEPIAEVTGDQRSFGFRKLRAMAKRVENKAKKICQHATKTLKNNCCPI